MRYVLEGSVQPNRAQVRVNAQLIDADSGAHLWAEQFDTARADLLQMQDEIVIHLARAMEVRLTEVEAARLKRTPAANPDAEDLALQCQAAAQKAGFIGKEADAGYPLCEQALRVDPNNVHALTTLGPQVPLAGQYGHERRPRGRPQAGGRIGVASPRPRPDRPRAHSVKAWILFDQGRVEEAIAERERALALDPAGGDIQGLAWDYFNLGQYEKGLETF